MRRRQESSVKSATERGRKLAINACAGNRGWRERKMESNKYSITAHSLAADPLSYVVYPDS